MTQGATTSKQAAPFKANPMEAIVRLALRRPFTFVVMAILIAIYGTLAAIRTPVDIFPNIGIPVISPKQIREFKDLPVKVVNGTMVYMRDVAYVHDSAPPQTNGGSARRQEGRAHDVLRRPPSIKSRFQYHTVCTAQ
jgi:multidrug efflux pump subunit AcrB